jgi:pimeloyl-ACP methyl ester carboxylesterase
MKAQSLKEERDVYDEFVRTHPKSCLDFRGQILEYIACGHGTHTLLIPPHISRLFSVEMGYRHILAFESRFRVIAPSLIETDRLDEIAASLLYVLEKETNRPVVLFGQSGSGITAQVFFRRNFQRVAGMILVNTVAPGHPAPRTPLFIFFKLLPAALLKFIFTKRLLGQLDTANLPHELIPRLQMSRMLLNKCLKERFSKRTLTIDMQNVMQFNAEGFVDLVLLSAWQGRILIVTSQDDAGYEDSKALSEKLPNARLLVFEKGYGHLAPLVKSHEVHQAIDQLMAELSQCSNNSAGTKI